MLLYGLTQPIGVMLWYMYKTLHSDNDKWPWLTRAIYLDILDHLNAIYQGWTIYRYRLSVSGNIGQFFKYWISANILFATQYFYLIFNLIFLSNIVYLQKSSIWSKKRITSHFDHNWVFILTHYSQWMIHSIWSQSGLWYLLSQKWECVEHNKWTISID